MSANQILESYEKQTGNELIGEEFCEFLAALRPDCADPEIDFESDHFEE